MKNYTALHGTEQVKNSSSIFLPPTSAKTHNVAFLCEFKAKTNENKGQSLISHQSDSSFLLFTSFGAKVAHLMNGLRSSISLKFNTHS